MFSIKVVIIQVWQSLCHFLGILCYFCKTPRIKCSLSAFLKNYLPDLYANEQTCFFPLSRPEPVFYQPRPPQVDAGRTCPGSHSFLSSRYLETRPIHPSQRFLRLVNDRFVFSLRVILNYELVNELLRLGADLKVLGPPTLVEMVKERRGY